MKGETGVVTIEEFVGLKSKMYLFLENDNKNVFVFGKRQ